MSPIAPPAIVPAPPRLPLPHGLFSVASISGAATERWENGVKWESTCLNVPEIVVADCDAQVDLAFPDDCPGAGEAAAFTVYGVYKGSTIGHTLDYAQERARQHLTTREEQAVEARLWQTITANTSVLPGGDAAQVLGQLEAHVASEYGSLGVLHVPRTALPSLDTLIEYRGGQLVTRAGTPVVLGSGYPGATPEGTALVGVTPLLFGYRSEVFTSTQRPGDLLDRSRNDLYGLAERNYLIGYEPCGVGVAELTLGCC